MSTGDYSPTLISVIMNTGCCPRGKDRGRTLWKIGEGYGCQPTLKAGK